MSNGDYNRTRILLENSPIYHVKFSILYYKTQFLFL
jgi:tetratricopeptide (TPR) repeat protein